MKCVTVEITNLEVNIFIDTGAARSCISENLYYNIEEHKQYPHQNPQIDFLRTANGQRLEIVNEVMLPLRISGITRQHPFIVVPGLSCSALLGKDFLKKYKDFSCVPQEEPLSVVVWKNASHDATSFHTIGTYPIQRLGDYVLIPPLKIGGAIQLEQNDGNFIQLDNNYVILRNSSSVNTSRLPDFYSHAKEQASKTSSGEHAALLTGHLVATFDIIFQNSRALWHTAANLKRRYYIFINGLFDTFPILPAHGYLRITEQ